MAGYLIQTDGRPLADVQRQLRKYLPGLDCRLFPVGPDRALLRGHLLEALQREYTAPPAVWLSVLGIQAPQRLQDDEILALLRTRDPDALPALKPPTPAPVGTLDWHLDMVRAPAAWQLLGGPGHIVWGSTKVAQLDTGYTRHPAFGFGAATWIAEAHARTDLPPPPNGGGNAFQTPEPGFGLDPVTGFNGGHGTRIGATISGHDLIADGRPFYGVAPKVPHLPIRMTDAVWINHAQRQFADGLDHAVHHGAGVVNVSLGVVLGQVLPEMKQALDRAYEAGVIVVCAAGNYVDPVVAPARLSRTVAVAGVTSKEQPWSGSSFGPEVDFSAPAADLRRADLRSAAQFRYTGGGDGTSYATAITTGAAALWLTHRRADIAAAYAGHAWCVPEAFRVLARQTARVPNATWQPDGVFGRGILDIAALLAAPLPAVTDLTKTPQV
ncbi:S8 family serine peptidase [Roseateles asaccharophilus]|uniref:Subtilisin family serine protease n=1 Tax=Roseateles asaccharophilus TaxID=582607 RepID=A0ABU2A4B5_9BURK|nr:S8 family serine peptidase [Roseateles asaccharophilus]MDR7332044.1 subtilisin family serine protease [Roseateles asaccharophilus]